MKRIKTTEQLAFGSEAMIDYDEDILPIINEWGKWQKILFAMLWLPSAFSAMPVFLYTFITYVPEHQCNIPQCQDVEDFQGFAIPNNSSCYHYKYLNSSNTPNDQCSPSTFDSSQEIYCDQGWTANTNLFTSTATIDFSMVCDSQWQISFAQSLYMGGMLVGSFIFGTLADWIGRRPTLVLTSLLLALSGSICALLPSSAEMYWAFAVLRFLMGMGHVGTFMLAFTLSIEYVGPKKRTFTGCIIEVAFALGGLTVGILSWAGIRNWRILMLVCSAPTILITSFRFFIPESPRWLIAKGKIEDLKKDVKKTAKINRTEFPINVFNAEFKNSQRTENAELCEEKSSGKASLVDLFTPRPILFRTLCMFYNWLVTTLCYYGLTMTASNLSDDIFVNYILVVIVELPANIFCVYAMDKFGRKPLLTCSQIVAGITCIAAGLTTGLNPWIPTILSIVGKFGATCCFCIVFVYTAEMFPTEIRSTAVGSSSTCARIGGILAPQVANLSTVWAPLPLLIFGGSALFGGIVAWINLPETLGKPLPETMEDAINLGKKTEIADTSQLPNYGTL